MAQKRKISKPDEQIVLLREIVAELRRLNANLEKNGVATPPMLQETDDIDDDDDSEELDHFE